MLLQKVNFRHVGLVVKDLEKSLKFWCEILNFKVQKQMLEEGPYIDQMMGIDGVRVLTTKIADDENNIIELLNFKSHLDKEDWEGKPYSTGLTHIALTVGDLKKTLEKMKRFKFLDSCETIPVKSPDGKVIVVYIKSFEGLLLELVEEL